MSFTRSLFTTVSLACVLPFAAAAQTPAADAPAAVPVEASAPVSAGDNTPVTHAELPALIKQALMNDPKMLMDAAEKFQRNKMEEVAKKSKVALLKHHDELFNDTTSPSVGPANADVTIVEFFDYHCGYCKRLLPVMTQLLDEDKKVRVIFREFPILSPDSTTAAKAALAVNRIAKDKYFEFHTDLMKNAGGFDEKTLLGIAKKLGINTEKLKTEMDKKEISDIIDENHVLGTELNITGTPALIMADEMTPGAVSIEELKKMVDNVRHGKSPTAHDPAPAKAPDAK